MHVISATPIILSDEDFSLKIHHFNLSQCLLPAVETMDFHCPSCAAVLSMSLLGGVSVIVG
jgi:hypothetical protein